MGPVDSGSEIIGRHRYAHGRGEAVRVRRSDRAEEGLPRYPEVYRTSEGRQDGQVLQHRQTLTRGLGESDSGIEGDPLARDAPRFGEPHAPLEKIAHLRS